MTDPYLSGLIRSRSRRGSLAMALAAIVIAAVPLAISKAEEIPVITATIGFVSPPSVGEPVRLDLIVWAAEPVTLSTHLSLSDGIELVDGELAARGAVGLEGVWKQSMTLVVNLEEEVEIVAIVEALTAAGELIQREKRLVVAAAPSTKGVDRSLTRVTGGMTISQEESVTRTSVTYDKYPGWGEDTRANSFGSSGNRAGAYQFALPDSHPKLPEVGAAVRLDRAMHRAQVDADESEEAERPGISTLSPSSDDHRQLFSELTESVLIGAGPTSAAPTIRELTGAMTSFAQPPSLFETGDRAPAAVDLIVEDIWSTTNPLQVGEVENVTFRIRNQGTTGTSTTFFMRLRIDGTVVAAWSSGGLSPGQAAQGSTTVTVGTAGTHQVRMEVDYTGVIVESNEGNNIRTENWSWSAPDRDLVVEDIWSTTNPLQVGEVENVTFRIKNVGTVGTSTTFYTRLWVDGAVAGTWSSGGLMPGQSAQGSTTVTVGTAGTHQVRMEVDYTGVIVESNEGNNVRTENWSWSAPDRDLVVEDIWSTTNPLQVGEVENVTFRIKNVGTVGTSTTFYTRLWVDGAVAGTWSSGGLMPGQSAQGSTTVTVGTAGTHQVRMEVDYTGVIVESNEGNNVRTENWSWSASDRDLVVEDIWSTTNPLQVGEVENVTFRIKNVGTVGTSTTFYTRLWVDGVVAATWNTPGLAAGGTATGSTSVTLASGGTHQLKVEVDYTGVVAEANEGNNERTENWFFAGIFVDGFESGDTSAWSDTVP